MKSILRCVIALFLILISYFGGFLFADNPNNIDDIELSRYYGVLPLHLNVHMEVGMGESNDEFIASYATLLQSMRFYADIDIFKYLKGTINPQKSLETVLNKMYNLLKTAEVMVSYIDTQKTNFVQKKDSCDDIKSLADKNFTLALKDADGVNMEKYLSSSIDSEKCSVESRISYNAYDKIKNQIKYYYDILAKKYDYFFSNKYDIIQSFN